MTEMSSENIVDAIEEGQKLRGWICSGYAQVEYLFGDIIVRSHNLDEYTALKQRLPHRPERRIEKIRQILETDGFFTQFRDEIEWLIGAFEKHQATRHLLVHGFCTAYHTPEGDFGLEFRKWHRVGDQDTEIRKTFRINDLQYEREQFTHAADRALHLSLQIHDALGLIEG